MASGVNNNTFVGFVAIYSNDYPNAPIFADVISAEDPVQGNDFGISLSLFRAGAAANFGYVLGVGAPGVSCAYVFTNNPGVNEWTQNSRLVAPSSNPLDTPSLFGFSIAVDEDAVLVGSPGTAGNSGSVVAFLAQNMSGQNPPVQWSQQAVVSGIHLVAFICLLTWSCLADSRRFECGRTVWGVDSFDGTECYHWRSWVVRWIRYLFNYTYCNAVVMVSFPRRCLCLY